MVTIEAMRAPAEGAEFQARVCVERRSDASRREGHAPPVIAETTAATPALALQALFGIASDNVAVARGLMQWQARRAN